jgi:hypothetical protein
MIQIVLLILISVIAWGCFALGGRDPLEDSNGVIPDEQTAIKIAEAILFRHYGEHEVKLEMPFKVKLEDGVWIINGTLPHGAVGGAFYIDIRQKDGCILQLGYPE